MDLRNFILKDSIYPNDLNFKVVSDIEKYIKDDKPKIFKLVISSTSNLNELRDYLKKTTNLTVYQIKKIKIEKKILQ